MAGLPRRHGRERPGRTAAPSEPDILWLLSVAAAKEQLIRALWAEAIRSGRSEHWVAREFERRLGVPPITACSARVAPATRPAATRRTP